jgi:hypothetical protein
MWNLGEESVKPEFKPQSHQKRREGIRKSNRSGKVHDMHVYKYHNKTPLYS